MGKEGPILAVISQKIPLGFHDKDLVCLREVELRFPGEREVFVGFL